MPLSNLESFMWTSSRLKVLSAICYGFKTGGGVGLSTCFSIKAIALMAHLDIVCLSKAIVYQWEEVYVKEVISY